MACTSWVRSTTACPSTSWARGARSARSPPASRVTNPTAAFSGDGSRLAEGLSDSRTRKPLIRVLDAGTGRELGKFEGQTGDSRQVALSPDGKTVAAAVSDFQPTGQVHDLRAWDVATGKSLWHADAGQVWLDGLAFSPDGKALAAMDPFGAVTLYDAAGGGVLRRLAAPPGTTNGTGLTFSPDGRLLAFGCYDYNVRKARVRVYEVAGGSLRHEFTGHDGPVTAVKFSPDGKRLASGGNDTTVLVWDLTGRTDGETARGKPGADELERLWEGLADADGRGAFKAMTRLAAAPDEAAALLAKHLKPTEGTGANVARLIAELDDDSFEVREAAHKQLAALGKSAKEALMKALADKPSAEVKRRIEDLVDRLKVKGPAPAPPSDFLRGLRAVEVLEDLGTAEAKRLLEALARGRAEASLTAAAKEALARLGRAGRP